MKPSTPLLLLLLLSIALALLTVLSGCTSALKRTDRYLSEGRVDEALATIEDYRREDPQNSDGVEAEHRVRQQWIADKLIQVRLLRLAGNRGQSGELLRQVLANESNWSTFPSGATFSTQADEVQELAEEIERQIQHAIKAAKPLYALARFRQEQNLLETTLRLDSAKIQRYLRLALEGFCHTQTAAIQSSHHYHRVFIESVCRNNGISTRSKRTQNSVTLFNDIQIDMSKLRLPDELKTLFADSLRQSFRHTPWFEKSSAAALPAQIAGSSSEVIRTRPVRLSKPYQARVPYQIIKVKEKRQASSLESFFTLVNSLLAENPDVEIDNRDGTVTVYETLYHYEERQYFYDATEVAQELSVDWTFSLFKLPFTFTDQFRNISHEHAVSFASAGLEPETRKLLKQSEWIGPLAQKVSTRVSLELAEQWRSQFCQESQLLNAKAAVRTEFFHRCAYGLAQAAPVYVADWFETQYGIQIETWRQLAAMSKWTGDVR